MIRFFAAGAAPVALRNSIILFAALVLSLVLVPIDNVALFFQFQIESLVGRAGSLPLAVGLAALGGVMAAQAGPSLRLGLGGWLRSLPVSATGYRRAMAIALIVTLTPLIVIVGASVSVMVFGLGSPVEWVRVTGLLCSLGLAGAAGVPVTRTWLARPLAMAGSIAALMGGPGIAGSLVLAVVWDRVAGPVVAPRYHGGGWNQGPGWLRPAIAWRALGPRIFPVLILPLVLGAAARFYRVNNGLTVAEAGGATRVLTSMALVLTVAGMADLLVTRRPSWPWARSLPVGSRARVLDDVITMVIPTAPTLVMALGLDWRALVLGLATLPALALLAAGAMRRAPGRISRASGEFLVTGSSLALAAAWWPVLAVASLGAVPLLWWHAARADRRLVVTRWQSLHHDAGGDSLAGDAR